MSVGSENTRLLKFYSSYLDLGLLAKYANTLPVGKKAEIFRITKSQIEIGYNTSEPKKNALELAKILNSSQQAKVANKELTKHKVVFEVTAEGLLAYIAPK